MASKKEPETNSPKVNFLKKLTTPKIMGRSGPRLKPADSDPEMKDLYQIVGIASGAKHGSTDFGEWTALTGNFAAKNLETGEEFRAGVAFLPDVGLDPILAAMEQSESPVEFGYTICIKKDETSTVGYIYIAQPMMKPNENDPLEKLTGHFSDQKKLSGPAE